MDSDWNRLLDRAIQSDGFAALALIFITFAPVLLIHLIANILVFW